MKKSNDINKNRKSRFFELTALIICILCISIGFLAYSKNIKIHSNLTANPDDLTFRVVFSTSNKSEKIEPIEPKIEPRSSTATAENGIIVNKNGPKLSNLNVKFTAPGQRARYTFYVYNAGEYMAYLDSIIYSNIAGTNSHKLCIANDGTTNESIKKACDNIIITIKTGNLETSKSLYYIENKSLRSRTGNLVEVTIEYLNGSNNPNKAFEVIFGDIYLNYAMFPGNGSQVVS